MVPVEVGQNHRIHLQGIHAVTPHGREHRPAAVQEEPATVMLHRDTGLETPSAAEGVTGAQEEDLDYGASSLWFARISFAISLISTISRFISLQPYHRA